MHRRTIHPRLAPFAVLLVALCGHRAMAGLGDGSPAPTSPTPQANPAAGASTTTSVDDSAQRRGLELGLRFGDQIPQGNFLGISGAINATQDTKLSDVAGSGFVVGFDIGHRVNRVFYYGFELTHAGLGVPATVCSGCSISSTRLGAMFRVHPAVATLPTRVDPYVGFGVNYDRLNYSGGGDSINVYGMEFANLHLGVDYYAMPRVAIGAYFTTSFAMYFGADDSDSSGNHVALHEWVSLGLRASYRL